MSTESKTIATPIPGQPWPKQGGIYVGTRVIDGAVVHIIAAPGVEHDIVGVQFGQVEAVIPAELNGHTDWRAPDQKDLMLAFVNASENFVHDGAEHLLVEKRAPRLAVGGRF